MKDYYKILRISKNASQKEIKQAYRKLAKKYHPDVNPDDKAAEAHFKEVSEAYGVLSDIEKKQSFDNSQSFTSIFDIFGAFPNFNQAKTRNFDNFEYEFHRHNPKPKKWKYNFELNLNNFKSGKAQKTIKLRTKTTCESCTGGYERYLQCNTCFGKGQINKTISYGNQTITTPFACDQCKGAGLIGDGVCRDCLGNGEIHNIDEYLINVNITKIN